MWWVWRMDGVQGDRIEVRLMNEHGCYLPLWTDEGLDEDLGDGLSDGLVADLATFAQRWEANIPPEVFDDRWVGYPVRGWLSDARYAVRRIGPGRRRTRREEDAAMRELGESLRARLQAELGPAYAVSYQHG